MVTVTLWLDIIGKDKRVTGRRTCNLPTIPGVGWGIPSLYIEPLIVEHIEADPVDQEVDVYCFPVDEDDRKLMTLIKGFVGNWEFDGFEKVSRAEAKPKKKRESKPMNNDDILEMFRKRGRPVNPGPEESNEVDKPQEDVPPAGEAGAQET